LPVRTWEASSAKVVSPIGILGEGGVADVVQRLDAPVAPASALLDSPSDWLSAMAGAAQERGDGLLAEVGVGPMESKLRRRVWIRLGEPVRFPSMTSVPLTWEPVG
jgi:hypothetical protein